MLPVKIDHCVIHVADWDRSSAKGPGTSVYFRDPDGSLMEFMSYGDSK
jgi:hypothetical protein